MKTLVLTLVSALMVSGCGVLHRVKHLGAEVQGSGVTKSEERKVDGFTRIVLENSAEVVAMVGPEFRVVIEGDDNIVPIIETTISKGSLIIRSEGSFSTSKPLRLTITAPNLEGIEIRGSGDARIEGVHADRFEASISGSGEVTVTGSAKHVAASIAGSGDLDLGGLKSVTAEASVSGSGDIAIHATESLDASIMGSGDIRYLGSPGKVKKSIMGSGDVRSS